MNEIDRAVEAELRDAELYRRRRLDEELIDAYDEELEMEVDDRLQESGLQITDEARALRRVYFRELIRLQGELVKLQDWIVSTGHRLVVIFEGRDAAGKGGVIKRITQRLNPRVCRIAALPAPNERERTQWYFQRYVAHLPAGGEIVLFDRSWYNRAGVERVMGFCNEEQNLRFLMRIHDPLKQWKLSPMDLESRRRWEIYTKAKEEMLQHTHIPEARWWVVEGVDKKRARLNCITHLLGQIPYQSVHHEAVVLPPRVHNPEYHRGPIPKEMYVPAIY